MGGYNSIKAASASSTLVSDPREVNNRSLHGNMSYKMNAFTY